MIYVNTFFEKVSPLFDMPVAILFEKQALLDIANKRVDTVTELEVTGYNELWKQIEFTLNGYPFTVSTKIYNEFTKYDDVLFDTNWDNVRDRYYVLMLDKKSGN